jgi:ornithine carbamoyltransferase
MSLVLLTPEGYGLTESVFARTLALSREFGGHVSEHHSVSALARPFDAVYTTRWQTTGTEKSDPLWRERFAPFRVSGAMMDAVSNEVGTVFMHDLPAVRGEDCDASVLDGPRSIAFEQAAQKLYTAMAILDWCVADD